MKIINKYTSVILFGMFFLMMILLTHSVVAYNATSTIIASSTASTTVSSFDSLSLIAGAIGVAIPWESVGVLGIILFAILLGLWGVYRKGNVRDWHH